MMFIFTYIVTFKNMLNAAYVYRKIFTVKKHRHTCESANFNRDIIEYIRRDKR